MKMPIVSLNNMAMNESVAATCCYRTDNINGAVVRCVLNGGWLDSKPSNNITYKVHKSWIGLQGDYQMAIDNPNRELVKQGDKWGYVNVQTGAFVALTANNDISGWELCDHSVSSCQYFNAYEYSESVSHVDSTVAHVAAKDWTVAHPAIRFNS